MGAIVAMGAIGVAGGILGGMQQGQAQKAQDLAQKQQTLQNNFVAGMAHDRQSEATAQSNVNSRINDQSIAEAANQNRFYASWQNRKQTEDATEMSYQQARAASATLESQSTGSLGSTSGGTSDAMARQASKAARDNQLQIRMKEYETEEAITQNYDNQMDQRSMGLSDGVNSSYVPGSTGVAPSASGAMVNGLFSGISGGLGMAAGMNGLMS